MVYLPLKFQPNVGKYTTHEWNEYSFLNMSRVLFPVGACSIMFLYWASVAARSAGLIKFSGYLVILASEIFEMSIVGTAHAQRFQTSVTAKHQ